MLSGGAGECCPPLPPLVMSPCRPSHSLGVDERHVAYSQTLCTSEPSLFVPSCAVYHRADNPFSVL